jgi:hypothetical protein
MPPVCVCRNNSAVSSETVLGDLQYRAFPALEYGAGILMDVLSLPLCRFGRLVAANFPQVGYTQCRSWLVGLFG